MARGIFIYPSKVSALLAGKEISFERYFFAPKLYVRERERETKSVLQLFLCHFVERAN